MTRGKNPVSKDKTYKVIFVLFLGLLCSALAGFIILCPIPFQSDDYFLISHAVKEPFTFLSGWNDVIRGMYRPLVVLYLFLQYNLYGDAPVYYYLSNLALHIANTLLVYLFLKKLFSQKFHLNTETSLLLSVFFFLVRFQSVTNVFWISAITDLLSFFFGILGMYFWISGGKERWMMVFSGTSFFLSLLSKETGLLFPYFAFIYSIYHKEPKGKVITNFAILAVPVLVYAVFRHFALRDEFLLAQQGLLWGKLGHWRNLLPALFLPFDVNDYNFIRWGNNNWLYLLTLPVLLLYIIAFFSFWNLHKNNNLKTVVVLILLSLSSMFLYSTYPPASRLTYINSLPLLAALPLMIEALKHKIRYVFSLLLIMVTLMGIYSELFYQSRQQDFQNELKQVIKTYNSQSKPLLVFPFALTSHQKYSFIPLNYTGIFWGEGIHDTAQGNYIWPVVQMANSLPEEHFFYEISVIDSVTLELNTKSKLANFLINDHFATGDKAGELYNEIIDSTAFYNGEEVVRKGPIARVYFNYEGVLKNDLSVLFVRDKNMKIEKLNKVLGIRAN